MRATVLLTLSFPFNHSTSNEDFIHACCMFGLSSSRLNHSKNVRWRVQIMKLNTMYFSPHPCGSLYYLGHNSPPLDSVLSQMHPVHTLSPCVPKIYSNIILPSTPSSFEWSHPFRFSNNNFVHISHLSHACYMPRPSHSPLSDHPNNIWWSV